MHDVWIVRQLGRPWFVAAVKSTLAAMAAWWLADRVVGSPQSFLAPYTALFMIGVTVRASGTAALRQVGVVSVGVVIAAAAETVLPSVAALAAAVALGTVVGRARVFTPDGMWISITALLVLLYGTATDETTIFFRITDVALGAIVGAVVNAVVLPPEFLSTARDLVAVRARGQAELLRHLSRVVSKGEPVEWELRTELWELFKASGVNEALDRGKDSLKGNFRRWSWIRLGGDEIYRPAATALDRTSISLAGVVGGVERLLRSSVDDEAEVRDDVADLLDRAADAMEELGYDPARHSEPYRRMMNELLPEAMRMSDIVHNNIEVNVAQREAVCALLVAVDSINATLYKLGEDRKVSS